MKRELPVYYINIDGEDCFMSAISLVDFPAVEHNFLAFGEQKLHFIDEERRLITGVVCLADTPIYRRDGRGEYYIVFTPETIEKMMLKYSDMGLFNAVNIQHDENQTTDGVKMIEFYMKDSAYGISPERFKDVPEGSLFATYKVTDEALWEEIRQGKSIRGFSLEIFADLVQAQDDVDGLVDELLNEK